MIEMKRTHIIAVFVIIILGFAVYANSLGNGFVYDDELVVESSPFLTSWSNLRYFFGPLYFVGSGEYTYRPVLTLTYFLDYHFWKFNPFGYHLTNVVIHVLNGILLYFFFLHLIPFLNKRLPSRPLAFLASVFFVLHPVQTEVVNGIAFRDDALASLFCFASLLLYLKTKTGLASGKKRFSFYVLSLLCYLLALLNKESAFPLIFIILLIDLCRRKGAEDTERPPGTPYAGFIPYIGYMGTICLYLFIRFVWMVNPGAALDAFKKVGYLGGSLYAAVLTTGRIFVSYLGLFVFPLRLSTEHYFRYITDPSYSFLEPRVFLSFAVLGLVAVFIIRSFRHRKVFAFSGLWVFVFLLTAANILPLYHPMAERYLYLPSAGFCLFLAATAVKFFYFSPGRISSGLIKKTAVLFVVLIVSFYSLQTIARNRVWKDGVVFGETVLKYPPVSARTYANLGNAYAEKGLMDKAVEQYQKAIKAEPDYPDTYNNLAYVSLKKGLYDEAVHYAQKALQLKTEDFYKAHYNLGLAYHRKGLPDKALEQYRKALDENPFNADIYNNMGSIYEEKGDLDKTVEQYEKAIRVYPHAFQPYYNLGNIYFRKGRQDKAIEYYRKALRINPALTDAHNNIGAIYFQKGLYDRAMEEFNKALESEPDNFFAHYNMGNIYLARDQLDRAAKQYKMALESNPDKWEAHNNLSVVYFKKGLYAEARGEWEKILEIDPNNSQARENLELLKKTVDY